MRDKPGLPDLLPPQLRRTKKRETRTRANKKGKNDRTPSHLLLHLHGCLDRPSLLPLLDLRLARTFPPWAIGVSVSGDSTSGDSTAPLILPSRRGGGGGLPPSRHRGGGDLHPLADKRASLLAAQAFARALWVSPQFAHLATPCVHGWPLRPSTGHRWSGVR